MLCACSKDANGGVAGFARNSGTSKRKKRRKGRINAGTGNFIALIIARNFVMHRSTDCAGHSEWPSLHYSDEVYPLPLALIKPAQYSVSGCKHLCSEPGKAAAAIRVGLANTGAEPNCATLWLTIPKCSGCKLETPSAEHLSVYRKYVTYIHFGPIAIVASLAWLCDTTAHERLLAAWL
ncbi:hypothetical protein An14g04120 [Aspergillus niger]|uniref:Uncharacterized protein n=2 Tax=Aspergillus niger TaxID=5061 RepID=A2R3F6_ASPNC|nr:hypothetical protein An14g04120 [Aspergillus niger]CAK46648.1 hypothetical protein An14g04120 [Aspergillus niger]